MRTGEFLKIKSNFEKRSKVKVYKDPITLMTYSVGYVLLQPPSPFHISLNFFGSAILRILRIRELAGDELSFHGARRALGDHGLVEVDTYSQEWIEKRVQHCLHSWTQSTTWGLLDKARARKPDAAEKMSDGFGGIQLRS